VAQCRIRETPGRPRASCVTRGPGERPRPSGEEDKGVRKHPIGFISLPPSSPRGPGGILVLHLRTSRICRTSKGCPREHHAHTTRITPGAFHLFIDFADLGCARSSLDDCNAQGGDICAPLLFRHMVLEPTSRSVPFVRYFFLHSHH
jgi:hypothetical protein